MSSHRIDKVEKMIKEEISSIFLQKFSVSEYGFITVTKVKMSPDLKNAKIYLSVLEKEKREIALDRILHKTGMVRTELAHRINLKFVPELKFFIDDTLDYVEKIEGLINKVHNQDGNKPNN